MREGCGKKYCCFDVEDSFLWRFSAVIKDPYYLFYDAAPSPYLFASDMDSMRRVYIYICTPTHNFF
jgi:hypothetical protein